EIKRVEIKLSAFFTEHNIAFCTVDHLIPLLKNICIFKISKFSVLIDESTDISDTKLLCILIKYVSPVNKRVVTQLFALSLNATNCPADNLYKLFKKYFFVSGSAKRSTILHKFQEQHLKFEEAENRGLDFKLILLFRCGRRNINSGGLAIRRNVNSIENMKKVIMAIYYHMCSTNENPRHEDCPPGTDSWCKWQKSHRWKFLTSCPTASKSHADDNDNRRVGRQEYRSLLETKEARKARREQLLMETELYEEAEGLLHGSGIAD
ncbi:hypothetical protein ALC56_13092, partial [Trachymyrmex septentrionalis]